MSIQVAEPGDEFVFADIDAAGDSDDGISPPVDPSPDGGLGEGVVT